MTNMTRAHWALLGVGLSLTSCADGEEKGSSWTYGGSDSGVGGSGGAGQDGGPDVNTAGASGWPGTGGSGGQAGSAGSAGTGGAIPDDPCQGVSDGDHCGADLVGGAPGSLYTCAAGATSHVESCAHGCASNACLQPPSDPCASAGSGDGAYCGVSLSGGDPNVLYQCAGGVTSSSQSCANGCQVSPPGTPDACSTGSADPCAGATSGNGLYCGQSLPGGDDNKLYNCQGGATASVQTCPNGCQVNPPGTADACAGSDPCASATSGNGAYCGQSLTGGDPNTLYTCTNGLTTNTVACPNGCKVNPPGTADACDTAGGDPCSSAGANGEYCGSSLSGGDSDSLYTCIGGNTASVVACSNGCLVNPPGTPDQCASGGSGDCCVDRPPGTQWGGFTACGGGGSHYGIDYGANVGTPIYAGISGTVSFRTGYPNCWDSSAQDCSATCYNTAFNYIRIHADCGDPLDASKDMYVYYVHIDDVAPGLQDGQHVSQGQYIADAGNSGCSSAPHIHLEIVAVSAGQNPSLHTCSSVNPTTRYCN